MPLFPKRQAETLILIKYYEKHTANIRKILLINCMEFMQNVKFNII